MARVPSIARLIGALAGLAMALGVQAQTCGNPPTNVVAGSGLCFASTRISWTNPAASGGVQPKVWRNTTSDFATATLVYNPGLGGQSTFVDVGLTSGVNYFYWVGADLLNCPGSPGLSRSPVVGPLRAGAFALNEFLAPEVTPECGGMRVSWQPVWDATAYEIVRVNGETPTTEAVGTVPVSATTFLDTSALPGNSYRYAVYARTPCGNATGAAGTGYLRAGPWANVAGQSVVADVGAAATLTVSNPLDGGNQTLTIPPPTSFTWTRNNVVVSNGGRISGNGTASLTITNLRLEDAGRYVLTLERPCGITLSVPVVLAVMQPCRADFDQSGAVGVQDIFEYVAAFFAGCP